MMSKNLTPKDLLGLWTLLHCLGIHGLEVQLQDVQVSRANRCVDLSLLTEQWSLVVISDHKAAPRMSELGWGFPDEVLVGRDWVGRNGQ